MATVEISEAVAAEGDEARCEFDVAASDGRISYFDNPIDLQRAMSDRRRDAIHQAGHAIVAAELAASGVTLRPISIDKAERCWDYPSTVTLDGVRSGITAQLAGMIAEYIAIANSWRRLPFSTVLGREDPERDWGYYVRTVAELLREESDEANQPWAMRAGQTLERELEQLAARAAAILEQRWPDVETTRRAAPRDPSVRPIEAACGLAAT